MVRAFVSFLNWDEHHLEIIIESSHHHRKGEWVYHFFQVSESGKSEIRRSKLRHCGKRLKQIDVIASAQCACATVSKGKAHRYRFSPRQALSSREPGSSPSLKRKHYRALPPEACPALIWHGTRLGSGSYSASGGFGCTKINLRRAAKARIERMVAPHSRRKSLEANDYVKKEWENGDRNSLADLLQNVNFDKDLHASNIRFHSASSLKIFLCQAIAQALAASTAGEGATECEFNPNARDSPGLMP